MKCCFCINITTLASRLKTKIQTSSAKKSGNWWWWLVGGEQKTMNQGLGVFRGWISPCYDFFAWHGFWNLCTIYFFYVPIPFLDQGKPQTLNQQILRHNCTLSPFACYITPVALIFDKYALFSLPVYFIIRQYSTIFDHRKRKKPNSHGNKNS